MEQHKSRHLLPIVHEKPEPGMVDIPADLKVFNPASQLGLTARCMAQPLCRMSVQVFSRERPRAYSATPQLLHHDVMPAFTDNV